MSSRRSGQRAPRVRLAPRAHSLADADDAYELGAAYGLRLDPWQRDVLSDWMGRTSSGEWAATICGLAVPRQNGKNAVIEVRELFGMIELGERFLHTAHEVKTARKAFLRIASFFENPRTYPELAGLVKEIRKTNGQEAVVLDNGGSVEFVARSRGSARGYTVDVLVLDEAQEFTDEAQEALAPTISSAPLGNPQRIMTGTPPGPKANGDIWRGIHRQGEAGKTPRLAWTDFGIVGPLPDIDDRNLWRQVNPALGGRLRLATIEDERAVFEGNFEGFARERLGWWGDEDEVGNVFGNDWHVCYSESQLPSRGVVLGLAVSFDLSHASVGVAARGNSKMFVGANRRDRGTAWVVDHLVEVTNRHRCVVAVDGGGPAADLIPALTDKGVQLQVFNTRDVMDACSGIWKAVTEDHKLAHPGHPELDAAVRGAVKRDVGDRWAWGRRKSTSDVSMLEAVTLAAWEVWRHDQYDVLDSVL